MLMTQPSNAPRSTKSEGLLPDNHVIRGLELAVPLPDWGGGLEIEFNHQWSMS